MDLLTKRQCVGADGVPAAACSAAGGRGVGAVNACTAAGGSCEVLRDGFYLIAGSFRFARLAVLLCSCMLAPGSCGRCVLAWYGRSDCRTYRIFGRVSAGNSCD